MYPYHNRIKQRIQSGELVAHYYADSYPRIGQALVLVFNTAPYLRPIRPHRWPEYQGIIKNIDIYQKSDKINKKGGKESEN